MRFCLKCFETRERYLENKYWLEGFQKQVDFFGITCELWKCIGSLASSTNLERTLNNLSNFVESESVFILINFDFKGIFEFEIICKVIMSRK